MLSGAASRDDRGVVEQAGWFGLPGARLFVFRHVPARPVATLYVCSPVAGDGDTNYRREVLLARRLATLGIAVTRWHWRGTGNSDGAPERLCLASMIDDAITVTGAAAPLTDGPSLVLGTRLSSFVAAAVAARLDQPRLVLWDPPVDGAGYFREVGRLQRVNKLAQAAGHSVDQRSLARELDEHGVSEVGGYEIHDAYYRSMMDRDWTGVDLPPGSDVLLLRFGGGDLPPALRASAERWSAAGARVATSVLSNREVWWFAPDDSAEEARPVTAEALERSEAWCAEQVASNGVPR